MMQEQSRWGAKQLLTPSWQRRALAFVLGSLLPIIGTFHFGTFATRAPLTDPWVYTLWPSHLAAWVALLGVLLCHLPTRPQQWALVGLCLLVWLSAWASQLESFHPIRFQAMPILAAYIGLTLLGVWDASTLPNNAARHWAVQPLRALQTLFLASTAFCMATVVTYVAAVMLSTATPTSFMQASIVKQLAGLSLPLCMGVLCVYLVRRDTFGLLWRRPIPPKSLWQKWWKPMLATFGAVCLVMSFPPMRPHDFANRAHIATLHRPDVTKMQASQALHDLTLYNELGQKMIRELDPAQLPPVAAHELEQYSVLSGYGYVQLHEKRLREQNQQ